MRVLFIAPTGFFADYGCHVRIRGHVQALQRRGHEVRIVTYPAGRDLPGLATIRPPWLSRHRRMAVGSSWRKIFLDLVLIPTIWAAFLRFHPQVIHGVLHEGVLLGWLPARLSRIPLIFDYQGSLTGEMIDHGFLSERAPWIHLWRWLERWIDHRPDVILASSRHGARMLRQRFGVPPARVWALPDSVDVRRFRPATEADASRLAELRARWRLPAGRPLVVYLGLLAPYQGTDLLLEAARILHQEGLIPRDLRPHFLIMGFPHLDRYRRQARRLGIEAHVTFTGVIPFEEAPHHLRLGTLAVAPKLSTTESSGKVLTYMATGLPVVAFDTAVHREYLCEFGVYARVGDARALAEGIAWLLARPEEREARGRALRARAVERFTWDHAAAVIERAYAEAASGRQATVV